MLLPFLRKKVIAKIKVSGSADDGHGSILQSGNCGHCTTGDGKMQEGFQKKKKFCGFGNVPVPLDKKYAIISSKEKACHRRQRHGLFKGLKPSAVGSRNYHGRICSGGSRGGFGKDQDVDGTVSVPGGSAGHFHSQYPLRHLHQQGGGGDEEAHPSDVAGPGPGQNHHLPWLLCGSPQRRLPCGAVSHYLYRPGRGGQGGHAAYGL